MTTAALRAVEAEAIAATPPGTLMARAAAAVADACASLLRRLAPGTPVLALAGPGNNGGDALLAALLLADRGWAVTGLALARAEPSASDARRVWRQWHERGFVLREPEAIEALLAEGPLVIDGMFGIGLARGLTGDADTIARRLARASVCVVAVDVPSGLDADRGNIVGGTGATAVRADVTVTMIADKPGLRTGMGCELAGRIVLADLGLDAARSKAPAAPAAAPAAALGAPGLTAPIAPAPGVVHPADRAAGTCIDSALPECGRHAVGRLVDRDSVRGLLPARKRDTHKGRFGDVLVVAGAPSMSGASMLAALGAQAVGAGRLYLGRSGATGSDTSPDTSLDTSSPELMSRLLDLDAGDPQVALGRATAIVVGCGLGRGAAATRALEQALSHPAALVLDADGLNAVAATPGLHARLIARARAGRISVLTPHPLEAARLLDTDARDIQHDRLKAAHCLAVRTSACVVLKGAGSVIALPDGRWWINGSGGPILSVAGTGDVLAGAIGGLLAAGLAVSDAARLGTWLHGAAGDRLASSPDWAASIGLPASRLPEAIRECVNRLGDDRS